MARLVRMRHWRCNGAQTGLGGSEQIYLKETIVLKWSEENRIEASNLSREGLCSPRTSPMSTIRSAPISTWPAARLLREMNRVTKWLLYEGAVMSIFVGLRGQGRQT